MFRFAIRDVLWLMVLVAVTLGLGLGWWRDRSRLAADNEAQYHRIYELTGEIKGRYPRVSEMYPPWRDPLEVIPKRPATDSRP